MKKRKVFVDADEKDLKSLNILESTSSNFNTQLGFSVCYTRVYNGLIRTVVTPEAIDQLFIPLPASFFINNK